MRRGSRPGSPVDDDAGPRRRIMASKPASFRQLVKPASRTVSALSARGWQTVCVPPLTRTSYTADTHMQVCLRFIGAQLAAQPSCVYVGPRVLWPRRSKGVEIESFTISANRPSRSTDPRSVIVGWNNTCQSTGTGPVRQWADRNHRESHHEKQGEHFS